MTSKVAVWPPNTERAPLDTPVTDQERELVRYALSMWQADALAAIGAGSWVNAKESLRLKDREHRLSEALADLHLGLRSPADFLADTPDGRQHMTYEYTQTA